VQFVHHPLVENAQATLHARSLTLLSGLENNLGRIALWWMAAIAAAASLRIAISPLQSLQPVSVAPYLLLVSLLVGMLLNVPIRAAEYLMTMPAIPAAAPGWLAVLHHAMTLDVVIVSSLYVVAFAMALRRSPLFPRFLAMVWVADVAAQWLIAQTVMATDVPPAVAAALNDLLQGNITKVAISVCLWLPYLLLSTRVNVTFRHRLPR
jgi:hypothetical protein